MLFRSDPTSVVDYQVRFTRPVVVPDTDDGVDVTFTGKINAVNDDGTIVVGLGATCDGTSVLAKATATVRT